mgnify:CR=1 FL=1
MNPTPVAIQAKQTRLAPAELDALRRAVEKERPTFAHRLAGNLQVNELGQPFFRQHRILEINSPLPFPAAKIHAIASNDGAVHVLTGHIENLAAAAQSDPPPHLDDADTARAYANLGDSWTTESEFGDFLVQSFAEIPWKPRLTDEERARVADLQSNAGAAIKSLALTPENDGFTLSKWVISNRRLISRRLHIPKDGRLRRDDDIRAAEIPVFSGRTWGFVNGRLVPTG